MVKLTVGTYLALITLCLAWNRSVVKSRRAVEEQSKEDTGHAELEQEKI
jgi:hypothetical protein